MIPRSAATPGRVPCAHIPCAARLMPCSGQSSRSSGRRPPGSPTLSLRPGPGAGRRGGQRRLDAAVPGHGHRHRQADRGRARWRAASPARHLGRHRGRQRVGVPAPGPARHRGDPGQRAGCRSWSAAPACTSGPRSTSCEFPGTDPGLRARLEDELARLGPAVLHARLAGAGPGRRGGDPAQQRPPHRPRPGGHRAVRPAVQRDAARVRVGAADRPDRGRRCPGPSWTSGSRTGSTGCGSSAWSTRSASWPRPGLRDGRTASRALGLRPGARLPGRRVDRGRKPPRRPSRRPGGSSAGRSPGSAATRGSAGCPASPDP